METHSSANQEYQHRVDQMSHDSFEATMHAMQKSKLVVQCQQKHPDDIGKRPNVNQLDHNMEFC